MNTKRLRVAFIDDGICENLLCDFNGNKIVEHWRFSKASITAYQGPTNILSHGTICASIFSEYAINCDIVDLSVFKECAAHREDIIDSILAALLWCAEHQIDLISMSVGTLSIEYADRLQYVLKKCKTLLVAACCNNNKVTFPACFPSVIGVRSIPSRNKYSSFFSTIALDGIDVYAALPENCRVVKSFYPDANFDIIPNSWVTPYVAALFTKMKTPFSIKEVKNYLQQYMSPMPIVYQYSFYDKVCTSLKISANASFVIASCCFSDTQIKELVKCINRVGYSCASIVKKCTGLIINNPWYSSFCPKCNILKAVKWIDFFFDIEIIILDYDLAKLLNSGHYSTDLIIVSDCTAIHIDIDTNIPILSLFKQESIKIFSERLISLLAKGL